MVVLLWGPAGDPPLQAVYQDLWAAGTPTFWLDQQAILQTQLEWTVDRTVRGYLQLGDQRLDLDSVTAAYLRPYDSRQMAAIAHETPDSPAWHHALALEAALLDWADWVPVPVLNRPSAMAGNHSKPYQLAQIQRAGFQVPETLITTDPAAALAFWQHHGTVIYKSISGVRSQVSRLTPAHREQLATLVHCPTQFQRYIPGRDYRVHVVGARVLACEVICAADDYRYAAAQLRPVDLPPALAQRCRHLAHQLQLPLAGIDLRRTPTEDWYCFEVNPSPGFTYYQSATNQPISRAIAHLLTRVPTTLDHEAA